MIQKPKLILFIFLSISAFSILIIAGINFTKTSALQKETQPTPSLSNTNVLEIVNTAYSSPSSLPDTYIEPLLKKDLKFARLGLIQNNPDIVIFFTKATLIEDENSSTIWKCEGTSSIASNIKPIACMVHFNKNVLTRLRELKSN